MIHERLPSGQHGETHPGIPVEPVPVAEILPQKAAAPDGASTKPSEPGRTRIPHIPIFVSMIGLATSPIRMPSPGVKERVLEKIRGAKPAEKSWRHQQDTSPSISAEE